jgi:hypothetical protein
MYECERCGVFAGGDDKEKWVDATSSTTFSVSGATTISTIKPPDECDVELVKRIMRL